jgi:multisubunit Na+/H+ antiporter MnhG subunit
MQAQPAMHSDVERASGGPTARLLKAAGRFVLEFVQMCAAMCVGGLVLSFLFFGAAGLVGFPDFVQRFTALSMLVLGINFALAMGTFMAIRGHAWRHNLEMSSTSIIAAILLMIGFWVGVVHVETAAGWISLFAFQCGPSCALMLVYMLFRFDHYSGGTGHRAHAG